jgi:outer membrane biosynthesis protein TonB
MAIKCNNCGAPIPAPPPDARFAACAYCGTAVALPARRPTVERAEHSSGPVPSNASTSASGGKSSFLNLPLVIGLVVGGGSLVAVTVKNLSSAAPAVEASAVATPREQDVGSTVPAAEEDAPSAANPSKSEEAARRDVKRDPRGKVPSPKPSAAAPKPTAPAAPTAPEPRPTPTATPTPTPTPPPVLKVAKASIGNVTVSGARSLSEVQSKLSALRGPIRDCYQKHLAERPAEAGTLDMRFSIDSQGRVAGAGARNPMFGANLVPCVNRSFYTMSFPPSDAGVVEVKLVVTLTSSP